MIIKIIQSNIQTAEVLIGIRSLLKMECIHILILMITSTSICNQKIIIIQQTHKVIKKIILISVSFYQTIDDKFQLDLRETNFGELIGFDKKLITKTAGGTKLTNITNSIDVLNINTNAIKDSIVDGINTNTIAVIPTDNLTRSYPITFEPRRVVVIIHLSPQNPHTPLYKTPIISMSFFVPVIISVYFSHFFNLKKNFKTTKFITETFGKMTCIF